MNLPEKLKNFIGSNEYFNAIDRLEQFLNINPDDIEKDLAISKFVDGYFTQRLSGQSLEHFAKNTLNFLSGDEVNKAINFMSENFFNLREELWQEEKIEEKETEESFEEKEKRYIEIMKELIKSGEIKLPPQREEKPLIEEKLKQEVEEFKTISFEPEEKIHLKEKIKEPELPESAIIIKRKKEEWKPKPEDEELIDLSKL